MTPTIKSSFWQRRVNVYFVLKVILFRVSSWKVEAHGAEPKGWKDVSASGFRTGGSISYSTSRREDSRLRAYHRPKVSTGIPPSKILHSLRPARLPKLQTVPITVRIQQRPARGVRIDHSTVKTRVSVDTVP
jgi:hypothetical protein